MHFTVFCLAALFAPLCSFASPTAAKGCTNINVYKPFYLTAVYMNGTKEVEKLLIEYNVFQGTTRDLQTTNKGYTSLPTFSVQQGRLVFLSSEPKPGYKVNRDPSESSPLNFAPAKSKAVRQPGSIGLVNTAAPPLSDAGCAVAVGGDTKFALCDGDDFFDLNVVVFGKGLESENCIPMKLVAVSKPPY